MAENKYTGPLGNPIRFNENDYPFWRDHFDEATKEAMIKEDLSAGEFVSAELMAIVFVGVLLGFSGVIWCCY